MIPKPAFNIGDIVYHITPESEPGVVVDIEWSYLTRRHYYIIALGWGNEKRAVIEELSEIKVFK